jgi:uncharacterized protein YqeY
MAGLLQRIQEAMKAALKAGDKPRLSALRLMVSAIKQAQIDQRRELDDAAVVAVLDRMAKQRRESIAQYEEAGRKDLADNERAELEVIREFLPQPLSEAEVESLIRQALEDTGATQIRDMGKVMGWLKPRLQGRADLSAVSRRVKERLAP